MSADDFLVRALGEAEPRAGDRVEVCRPAGGCEVAETVGQGTFVGWARRIRDYSLDEAHGNNLRESYTIQGVSTPANPSLEVWLPIVRNEDAGAEKERHLCYPDCPDCGEAMHWAELCLPSPCANCRSHFVVAPSRNHLTLGERWSIDSLYETQVTDPDGVLWLHGPNGRRRPTPEEEQRIKAQNESFRQALK